MPHSASSRREFLKHAVWLPLSAAAVSTSVAADTASSRPPNHGLKLSLNAYSFNDLLLNAVNGKTPAMSLIELLDFCAQHDFEALDPTGYYFPGYPAVPEDAFLRKFKRHAHRVGIAISGTGVRNNFAQADATARAA